MFLAWIIKSSTRTPKIFNASFPMNTQGSAEAWIKPVFSKHSRKTLFQQWEDCFNPYSHFSSLHTRCYSPGFTYPSGCMQISSSSLPLRKAVSTFIWWTANHSELQMLANNVLKKNELRAKRFHHSQFQISGCNPWPLGVLWIVPLSHCRSVSV